MKAAAVWVLLAGALMLWACSSDEDDAASKLEAACNDFCDATFAGGCSMPGITVEQCHASCGYLETQLGGMCVAEYTAVFECTAAGGFTCSNGIPVPNDPCLKESQAFQTCSQAANCQRFCDAAAAAGCAPGGTASACVTSCDATVAELGNCAFGYDIYLQCAARFDNIVRKGTKITAPIATRTCSTWGAAWPPSTTTPAVATASTAKRWAAAGTRPARRAVLPSAPPTRAAPAATTRG